MKKLKLFPRFKVFYVVLTGAFFSIFSCSAYAEVIGGAFPASFGPSYLDGRTGFTIDGLSPQDRFGLSASDVGDINCDGKIDFAVGNFRSEIYVFFGHEGPWPVRFSPADLNGDNGFTVFGVPKNVQVIFVSSAGDVNGDGRDDCIIGVSISDTQGHRGQVYIIFGSGEPWPAKFDLKSINGSNGAVILPAHSDEGIGIYVSKLGDFNDDGIDDILIGTPIENDDSRSQGYIVFGRKLWPAKFTLADLDGENGFAIETHLYDIAGTYAGEARDINGDGIPDAIMGSFFSKIYGRSYVIYGGKGPWLPKFNTSKFNGENGFLVNDIELNSERGNPVSGAGDFDSDGVDDLIFGTPFGGNDRLTSRSYLLRGRKGSHPAEINLGRLNRTDGFVMNVTCPDDICGTYVSWLGDVNGDRKDDIILGSPWGGNDEAGQSYILYGHKGPWYSAINLNKLNGTNGFIFNGLNPGDACGGSVKGIKDINSDGNNDFIICAPFARNRTGSCYIIFGRDETWKP